MASGVSSARRPNDSLTCRPTVPRPPPAASRPRIDRRRVHRRRGGDGPAFATDHLCLSGPYVPWTSIRGSVRYPASDRSLSNRSPRRSGPRVGRPGRRPSRARRRVGTGSEPGRSARTFAAPRRHGVVRSRRCGRDRRLPGSDTGLFDGEATAFGTVVVFYRKPRSTRDTLVG